MNKTLVWWNPKHVKAKLGVKKSCEWQPVWLNLPYQKIPLSDTLPAWCNSWICLHVASYSFTFMLFVSRPLSEKSDIHILICVVVAYWKINCTPFGYFVLVVCGCLWFWDGFGFMYSLLVFYYRVWLRALCLWVVILARQPLTRCLRRQNMLIKLKTSRKNLHQMATLVVIGAVVRLLCARVYVCVHCICVMWSVSWL